MRKQFVQKLPMVRQLVGQHAFTPAYIDGLQLWYRAESVEGLNDADPVPTWNDESGYGRHATTVTTATRPTYRTNVVNGRPVLRFDSKRLNVAVTIAAGPYTFIIACYPHTNSIYSNLTYILDVPTGRLIFAHTANSTSHMGWFDGSWAQVGAPTKEAWQILSWVLEDPGGEVFRNGVSTGTGAYTSIAMGGTSRLGNRAGATDNHFRADIAEVILYNSAVSVANRGKVETYLSNKYDIAI